MLGAFYTRFLDAVGANLANSCTPPSMGLTTTATATSSSSSSSSSGDDVAPTHTPLIFTRLGNVVLMQAFLYLRVHDCSTARLASKTMCKEVRNYAVTAVKYLPRKGKRRCSKSKMQMKGV